MHTTLQTSMSASMAAVLAMCGFNPIRTASSAWSCKLAKAANFSAKVVCDMGKGFTPSIEYGLKCHPILGKLKAYFSWTESTGVYA